MFNAFNEQHFKEVYISVYKDILENKNLSKHLQDVEAAILDLDEIIVNERESGKTTPGFDSLKNEFFLLKFEILERL